MDELLTGDALVGVVGKVKVEVVNGIDEEAQPLYLKNQFHFTSNS